MYDIDMKDVYKILRIICCIASALILAVAVFIFIYLGWQWGLLSLLIAAVLFGLTVFFKSRQQAAEEKENPKPKTGDFITGPVQKNDGE